ncbi:MAG: type II toxin-antitoxin system VapC family toxin [Lacisediminihabitans sp.]
MIAYVETSAAAKMLFDEGESARVTKYLDGLVGAGHWLASSAILETELRRAAVREGEPQSIVTAILDRVSIVDISRSVFTQAGVLSGTNLRSLDALHVAAALHMNADVMVSYDRRQIDAAEAAGLRTVSP